MVQSSDEALGILLLLVSLVCLGTWPALLRLGSMSSDGDESSEQPETWSSRSSRCTARIPMLLKPTQRHVCHVYLDYSLTYFLISSIPFLLVLSFFPENRKVGGNSVSLLVAVVTGGVLLSCGNLSLQWATAVYGAPLTTVVAIQASLTVCLGTSINYLLEPSMTRRPTLLWIGVSVFMFAIALATRAQLMYTASLPHKHRNHKDGHAVQYTEIEMKPSEQYGSTLHPENNEDTWRDDGLTSDPAERRESRKRGLVVAFLGGLCFGFFSPAFNIAVNDPFDWTGGHSLSVVHANVWFSASFWVASLVGNITLLYREQSETTLGQVWCRYLALRSGVWNRRLAILAGGLCALGNVLQFQGGKLVGFATADLVQAYPLVSTLWDVFLFGEFAQVQFRSAMGLVLICMYLAYLSGIGLLASSSAGD